MHVRSAHKGGRQYECENENISFNGRTPKTDKEAFTIAKATVEWFNDTLRENEIPRELVSVKRNGKIIKEDGEI